MGGCGAFIYGAEKLWTPEANCRCELSSVQEVVLRLRASFHAGEKKYMERVCEDTSFLEISTRFWLNKDTLKNVCALRENACR